MLADRRHADAPSSSVCPSLQRIHCHFTGRVQGVGFRYTVKNIALSHDVSGYVRNLPDGRVELLMEGPPSEIDQVINGITSRMNDYIKNIERLTMPATGEFDHFRIKH